MNEITGTAIAAAVRRYTAYHELVGSRAGRARLRDLLRGWAVEFENHGLDAGELREFAEAVVADGGAA